MKTLLILFLLFTVNAHAEHEIIKVDDQTFKKVHQVEEVLNYVELKRLAEEAQRNIDNQMAFRDQLQAQITELEAHGARLPDEPVN